MLVQAPFSFPVKVSNLPPYAYGPLSLLIRWARASSTLALQDDADRAVGIRLLQVQFGGR